LTGVVCFYSYGGSIWIITEKPEQEIDMPGLPGPKINSVLNMLQD